MADKIQIHLPIEAADHLMSVIDPEHDYGAAGVMPEDAQNPALSPIQRINAMAPTIRARYPSPAQPNIGSGGAVPSLPAPIGRESNPADVTALPPALRQMSAAIEPQARPTPDVWHRIGGILGRIGGYALSAAAPGIAAEIPQTPLGRIAAQRRKALNELTSAETRAANDRAIAAEHAAEAPKTVESGGLAYEYGGKPGVWNRIGTYRPLRPLPQTPAEETIHDLMTGNNGQPRINPDTNKPYTELGAYGAVEQAGHPRHQLLSPFEAFAYGTPEERKSAEDFIAFERKQGARNDKPGEIEQKYALYKRDQKAYEAMFGDRGAERALRDRAQAARMVQYFDKQRKAIQNDPMLYGDQAEMQQQLSEIDSLEQPYRDLLTESGGHKVGDEVSFKGQPMKVLQVLPDGKLELEPVTAGAQ